MGWEVIWEVDRVEWVEMGRVRLEGRWAERRSVLPRVFPYSGGGGTAIMLSSTSPVPLTPSAAAYVGNGGLFQGASPITDDPSLPAANTSSG